MKPYIPAITVLVVLAALVGVGLLTAGMFQSPQAHFNQQVDEKVEKAQRLLARYEGGQPMLLDALQRLSEAKAEPSTRPSATEPDAKADKTAAVEPDEAPVAGRHDYQSEMASELERRRQGLEGKLTALGGQAVDKATFEFASAEELRKRVEANAGLLDEALQSVRDALNISGGEGLSGESHAVATRLEALLIRHQADLKGRQAAVYHALADARRGAFVEVLLTWHQADNRVKTIQAMLNGTAGGSISREVPVVATQPAPAATPASSQTAKSSPSPAPGLGSSSGGWLRSVTRNMLKNRPKSTPEPSSEPETPAPAPSDNTTEEKEKPAAETEKPAADTGTEPPAEEKVAAPTGPVAVEAVPSIDERIKQLQALGRETDAKIADTQKEADRLSAAVSGLQGNLDQARAKAKAAEERMFHLEETGVDAADPSALKRFMDEYAQAAGTNREAAREADVLEYGVLQNARPDVQEENDILTAPLVPIEPGRKIKAQPGLAALRADLEATKALLESKQEVRKPTEAELAVLPDDTPLREANLKELRKLIDAQIKALEARRDQLQGDLVKAQAWRTALTQAAKQLIEQEIDAVQKARKLETEAVELLSRDGQRAAQRAVRAADERARQVQDFYQKNAVPAPQVGFMAGHAAVVAGDIEFQRAVILAQESEGLRHQEILLAQVAPLALGIDPAKLSAAKSAGDASANSEPTSPADAAVLNADALSTQALEAAQAALKHYDEASGKLGRLWSVHAQMANVHYLMATLKSDNEAQKERAAALREVQMATRDRPEQVRAYRPMVDALSAQQ